MIFYKKQNPEHLVSGLICRASSWARLSVHIAVSTPQPYPGYCGDGIGDYVDDSHGVVWPEEVPDDSDSGYHQTTYTKVPFGVCPLVFVAIGCGCAYLYDQKDQVKDKGH